MPFVINNVINYTMKLSIPLFFAASFVALTPSNGSLLSKLLGNLSIDISICPEISLSTSSGKPLPQSSHPGCPNYVPANKKIEQEKNKGPGLPPIQGKISTTTSQVATYTSTGAPLLETLTELPEPLIINGGPPLQPRPVAVDASASSRGQNSMAIPTQPIKVPMYQGNQQAAQSNIPAPPFDLPHSTCTKHGAAPVAPAVPAATSSFVQYAANPVFQNQPAVVPPIFPAISTEQYTELRMQGSNDHIFTASEGTEWTVNGGREGFATRNVGLFTFSS